MTHATLTVWRFTSVRGAEEAAQILRGLAEPGVVALHDVAAVSWDEGEQKPRTHLLAPTPVTGAIGGSFWGLLFGLIFFVPLLGAALGTATGALAGCLHDVGIDDGFINKVRDQVTPGTSALFVLTTDAAVDVVRDAFVGHEPDSVIVTNLTDEQESALRQVFDGQ